MSSLTDISNFDFNLDEDEDEDVTAAAEVHTGAMIALIPSHDDAMRIVVDGGEPADQLHCTLEYLGEVADIPDEVQQQIMDKVIQRAQALDVIEADGFAVAIFNPGEHEQPDGKERDACVVLLLSGDELAEAYELICGGVKDITGGEYAHKPWIPHITLAYRDDADLTDLVDQVGPITFDTVRVAFGGEIYDIPLGQEESGQTGTNQPELETSGPPQTPKQTDTYTEPTAASAAFDFNENQPRDPHSGEWVDTGGVVESVLKSFARRLRKADRGDKVKNRVVTTDHFAPRDHKGKPSYSGVYEKDGVSGGTHGAATYQGNALQMNGGLRDGSFAESWKLAPDGTSNGYTSAGKALDEMFTRDASKVKDDIVVHRGILEPKLVFGDKWSDDSNVGLTWVDPGYTSVSWNEGVAKGFTTTDNPFVEHHGKVQTSGGVLMNILVPKGSHAVRFGTLDTHEQFMAEDEIVLPRESKFRIIADHGVDENGMRLVDVELVSHRVPQQQLPDDRPGYYADDFAMKMSDATPMMKMGSNVIDVGPAIPSENITVEDVEDNDELDLSENEVALVCSVLGLTLDEFTMFHTFAQERDVNLPGEVGHQLRDYWVRGPGAAKIRWNTEGDGTRCIKLLKKHVGVRAGGLCQEYHRMATGTTMGRHPGRPTEAAVGNVIPFDFDEDQDRWPAGAPGGLGGQWRDTHPGKLSDLELVNHIWEARNAPSGTKILSGVDTHDSRHDLMSNGNGTISAYNDYSDDAVDTFYEKSHLIEWLKLEGQYGGGDDVTWDKLKVPADHTTPDIMKWLTPEVWDAAEAYDYIDQNSWSWKNGDVTVATSDGQSVVVYGKNMSLSIWKWDSNTDKYVRNINNVGTDDMAKISNEWYQVHENTPTITKLGDSANKPVKRVKVSSPPDTTSSPALKTSLDKLLKVTGSDHVKTDDISSGQVGIVSKITTKDGTYIRKENKSWGSYKPKDLADAEELVSELGLRIGARVPAVERVNKSTVHIEFVDGFTAAEHEAVGKDVKDIPDQRSSRMIGLLDLITLNGDRHEGNWIVNEHDDPPVAYGIDHGLSWAPLPLTYTPSDAELEVHISSLGSPFIPNFVPYDELFSKGDIQRARSALDIMESRFNEMGKQHWLSASRQILNIIEAQMDMTLGQHAS